MTNRRAKSKRPRYIVLYKLFVPFYHTSIKSAHVRSQKLQLHGMFRIYSVTKVVDKEVVVIIYKGSCMRSRDPPPLSPSHHRSEVAETSRNSIDVRNSNNYFASFPTISIDCTPFHRSIPAHPGLIFDPVNYRIIMDREKQTAKKTKVVIVGKHRPILFPPRRASRI